DRAAHRATARTLPEDSRLALVRDPDRVEVVRGDPGVGERVGRSRLDGRDELGGIVLDPAWPREVLRHLPVTAPADLELGPDDEAGRPGRALVDGEDHASERISRNLRPTFVTPIGPNGHPRCQAPGVARRDRLAAAASDGRPPRRDTARLDCFAEAGPNRDLKTDR